VFNVSGPADLRLNEVRLAANEIRERADADANVIFGASFGESLGEDVLITLIATGLKPHKLANVPSSDVTSAGGLPSIAESEDLSRRPMLQSSSVPDAVDLDVPSFTRRKRERTSRN
jgi:cell division protein FtsZ